MVFSYANGRATSCKSTKIYSCSGRIINKFSDLSGANEVADLGYLAEKARAGKHLGHALDARQHFQSLPAVRNLADVDFAKRDARLFEEVFDGSAVKAVGHRVNGHLGQRHHLDVGSLTALSSVIISHFALSVDEPQRALSKAKLYAT